MKKYMHTILRGLVLLQALMLGSCHVLHDDLSECDLFLRFRYDYNLSYEDWFGRHVEEVRVFIFDKEGKYVQTLYDTAPALAADGYAMPIPYEMKGYTAVVWAGKTGQDYLLPQLAVGDPIGNLTLRYEPGNNTSSHQMASLWHCGPCVMAFAESGGREQTISLVRNTNDLHLTMRAASVATTQNFEITLKGANGSFDHKNNFLTGSPVITYLPTHTPSQETADMYTMRLVKGSPLLLTVKDKDTGKAILIEGETETDLVELLLKGKIDGMTEQEYLDRRYIWDITLNYNASTFLAVSVTINGWTHWFHNTDL